MSKARRARVSSRFKRVRPPLKVGIVGAYGPSFAVLLTTVLKCGALASSGDLCIVDADGGTIVHMPWYAILMVRGAAMRT